MQYLCLAYGDEKDWNALSKEQQDEFLAQDEVVRNRGALTAAVKTDVVTVTAWNGKTTVTEGVFGSSKAPLAGFSIIEAADVNEIVQLVADRKSTRLNSSHSSPSRMPSSA